MRLQQAGATLTTFFLDGSNDCFALAERTRGDMNIAEQNVVLCAFMRCHMSHAAGTDDKNIAFHWITPQSRKHEQYCRSGQTVDVVVKGKFAHQAHGADRKSTRLNSSHV